MSSAEQLRSKRMQRHALLPPCLQRLYPLSLYSTDMGSQLETENGASSKIDEQTGSAEAPLGKPSDLSLVPILEVEEEDPAAREASVCANSALPGKSDHVTPALSERGIKI